MKKLITGFIAVLFGIALMSLGGCADIVLKKVSLSQARPVSVSCIGVLPTDTEVDYDHTLSYKTARSLEMGSLIMDSLLREQLAGKDKIRFINKNQLEGLVAGSGDQALEVARVAAQTLNCNAILQTRLKKFQNRIGQDYSVQRPAGATFEYRLIEVTNGKLLCAGEFDESQTSILENLFTFNKAVNRGFRWISVEDLLREGIQDRFGECTYLPK